MTKEAGIRAEIVPQAFNLVQELAPEICKPVYERLFAQYGNTASVRSIGRMLGVLSIVPPLTPQSTALAVAPSGTLGAGFIANPAIFAVPDVPLGGRVVFKDGTMPGEWEVKRYDTSKHHGNWRAWLTNGVATAWFDWERLEAVKPPPAQVQLSVVPRTSA